MQPRKRGRPPESIWKRLARHVQVDGKTITPEELERLHQEGDQRHWIWTGANTGSRTLFKHVKVWDNAFQARTKPQPRITVGKTVRHPVRALNVELGLPDVVYRRRPPGRLPTTPFCSTDMCVNPHHYHPAEEVQPLDESRVLKAYKYLAIDQELPGNYFTLQELIAARAMIEEDDDE